MCKKSDKVLKLSSLYDSYKNETHAIWVEAEDISLNRPKSSSTLALVPRIYGKNCHLL